MGTFHRRVCVGLVAVIAGAGSSCVDPEGSEEIELDGPSFLLTEDAPIAAYGFRACFESSTPSSQLWVSGGAEGGGEFFFRVAHGGTDIEKKESGGFFQELGDGKTLPLPECNALVTVEFERVDGTVAEIEFVDWSVQAFARHAPPEVTWD